MDATKKTQAGLLAILASTFLATVAEMAVGPPNVGLSLSPSPRYADGYAAQGGIIGTSR
jgi:hypothetical protein